MCVILLKWAKNVDKAFVSKALSNGGSNSLATIDEENGFVTFMSSDDEDSSDEEDNNVGGYTAQTRHEPPGQYGVTFLYTMHSCATYSA